jgi:hypothetical protein
MCTGQDPSELNRSSPSNDDTGGSGSPQPSRGLTPIQVSALASSSRSNLHTPIEMRQNLAAWTDDTLKKLVRQCRDWSPSKRPPMISVVLALQQIKVRHALPSLQLHLSPHLGAAPLPYSPRKAITLSAPSTPEMRVRQRPPHTITVQPAASTTDPRRHSPYQRRLQELMTPQDDFLASIQNYLEPNPGHSRERSPQWSVNSSAYRGASQHRQRSEDRASYNQPMTPGDHPTGGPYHLPRESPSLRPWVILPPLPSTSTLQPPNTHLDPYIHGNKSL